MCQEIVAETGERPQGAHGPAARAAKKKRSLVSELNRAKPALNKYRAFSTYGNPDLLVGYLVLDYLRESIALSPREYTNYEMLAGAYMAMAELGDKRYESRALDTLLYALRYVHPHAPSAKVHVAAAHRAAGRPDRALPYAREAVMEDPHYAEAAYELGAVYEALGQKSRALRSYRRAVTLRRKDVNAKSKSYPAAKEAIERLTRGR